MLSILVASQFVRRHRKHSPAGVSHLPLVFWPTIAHPSGLSTLSGAIQLMAYAQNKTAKKQNIHIETVRPFSADKIIGIIGMVPIIQ